MAASASASIGPSQDGTLNGDTVKLFADNKKLKRKNAQLQTQVEELQAKLTSEQNFR